MSLNNVDKEFENFKQILEHNLQNSIPELTNIANDLRLTKSNEISKLILSKLEKSNNDDMIILYFKLIDSILISINASYNKKLSVNLSTLFKKKYLTMNNSNRQKLIELFETWVERVNMKNGVSGDNDDDDDLFEDSNKDFLPKDTLKNIETFLVKASLLHEKRFLQKNQIVPKIEDLLKTTERLIFFIDKTLDKNYSDELYERLTFIKKINDILKNTVLEEKTLIEMDIQLKSLPEYKQSLNVNNQDTVKKNGDDDDRVNKFIEKSKNVKVDDLKQLLSDLKSLDLIKLELEKEKNLENNEKSIMSIWGKDSFESSLEKYNKKINDINGNNHIENDDIKERDLNDGSNAKISSERLPDLNLLSNINKDLQSSKLSLPDFLQINIETNNFHQWSKYIQLLYRNLPEKCQICGKRFPLSKPTNYNFKNYNNSNNNNNKRSLLMAESATSGKDATISSMQDLQKNIEQHMDMHHESMSKSTIITKQGIRKVMVNRTWYTSPLQKNSDKNGESTAIGSTKEGSSENNDDHLAKKRKIGNEENDTGSNNITESYVIVPRRLMGNLNGIECEICRDTIKVSFLESVGEWCLLDCKEQGDGFVHLSCL